MEDFDEIASNQAIKRILILVNIYWRIDTMIRSFNALYFPHQ